MAHSALQKGCGLTTIAHRNRAPVDRLVADGAREAADLAALAEQSDVIAICVSDAPAVEQVIGTLRPHLRPGQLIVDITTSDPAGTRRLAASLRDMDIAMADAPVTGSPIDARAGAVATLLGCAPEDEARASAIVGLWSTKIRRFGDVGTGHTAKLINNFVTQGTAALLAEAYNRARRAGIDWSSLHAVQHQGAARSGTFEKMITPAVSGNFDGASFALSNSAKDARYYAALALVMDGQPSPLAEAIHQSLARFVDAGHGDRMVSRMLDPEVAKTVGA